MEWISAKKEKPAVFDKPVLTFSEENGIAIGMYLSDKRWRIPAILYPCIPTHWMPLPEPPK